MSSSVSRAWAAAWGFAAAFAVGSVVMLTARAEQSAPQATVPATQPATPQARGRYLIMVGGCNDCHTPNFMQRGLDVPEDEWLTGLAVGFRGPWGTTYGSNLRLTASKYDEDLFVAVMRARNSRPPMVWHALHSMTDGDMRALFRYIRSLPVKGTPAPEYVPPGVEPTTPYLVFEPQMPKTPAEKSE